MSFFFFLPRALHKQCLICGLIVPVRFLFHLKVFFFSPPGTFERQVPVGTLSPEHHQLTQQVEVSVFLFGSDD